MENKNVLLKELWTEWLPANIKTLKAELKRSHPEVKKLADQAEIMGYETYAVLQTKEDREPLVFFTIDYSEPTLIPHYL